MESPFFLFIFRDMTEQAINAQTYKLPESARNNARQVLEWREEHGSDVKGLDVSGNCSMVRLGRRQWHCFCEKNQ